MPYVYRLPPLLVTLIVFTCRYSIDLNNSVFMKKQIILLIEDDPIWQIRLKLMLEDLNDYEVMMATTLAEAKNVLTGTFYPDFILADVVLPDGLSYHFFEENKVTCPLFFMTEYAEKRHLEHVLRLPLAHFFVKPIHSLTLEAAIQKSLNQHVNTDEPTLEVPVRYAIKRKIALKDIYWIEVKANYVSVKTLESIYVFKGSFPLLEKSLDERFIRISKSIMVNKDLIKRVNLKENTVHISEKTFDIGRLYRKAFIQKIYSS